MRRRLFVGLPLPLAIKDVLFGMYTEMPGVIWKNEYALHLTLAFMGAVDGDTFLDVRDALADVIVAPFPLSLQHLGVFPLRGIPRTLWIGVFSSGSLSHLVAKVERVIRGVGVRLERRKHFPHVTLAYVAHAEQSRLHRFINAHVAFTTPTFTPNGFALVESVRLKHGMHYEEHAFYPFVNNEGREENTSRIE